MVACICCVSFPSLLENDRCAACLITKDCTTVGQCIALCGWWCAFKPGMFDSFQMKGHSILYEMLCNTLSFRLHNAFFSEEIIRNLKIATW